MSNNLTKEDIQILLMKEQYGMSYSAIAKQLAVSKTRVRTLYDRAKNRERISKLPDDPNKLSFDDFAMKNLEPGTYTILKNAKITTYHDFIKMDTLDLFMIKGIGPAKVEELIKFKEKIINLVKK